MKYIKIITPLLCSAFVLSCKKQFSIVTPVSISAVTVVNATVGSSAIIPIFSNEQVKWFNNSRSIGYGSFYEYSIPNGTAPFAAYQTIDTVNAIYATGHDAGLNLKPQSIYSLFLCGQVTPTLNVEYFSVEDHLPYHPATDSSVGVRFINLSPGSNPVNVTLSTNTTVNEVSNIAYKTITDFKNYPAIASVGSYTFQFRDATTNTMLGSFTMNGINNGTGTNTAANTYRFRNFTLVLKGLPGGTGGGAQGTFLVKNY